ncbi:diacylglyceryl transferase [Segetibacter sp. 3557_3]|uniref:prolipoprotein diacylglyceryl transferase n=1 Tax=Segetibacter sp. 3557_3 TaxID=2547429 RepID=UPI0010590C7A|nr:prolipoprotein diacylglyceryl transferase family protein [Segetibacter sp. 3557_3]TDH28914.1 diacylglyceryl transferase [Segetibacter sp. 3557_3]
MYPNLYYAFKDLFGVEWSGLKLVNSFGFFVALAFMIAAWTLTLELARKSKEGLLTYKEEKIMVGQPATLVELLLNFVLGFIMGYKIVGAFIDRDALADTQTYILSSQGNVPAGIFVGLLFAGLKWYEKNKLKLAKPEERTIRIWPQDRVGDLVIYAAVFGFLGAKIFHNLENLDEFAQDPWGSLISFSGLTFYGGLICATIAIWFYCRRNNMKPIHVADAFAPPMMLAYGIGRMGCQVAGDGDWGIVNNSPKPFSWLPDWAWSYTYPNNVVNEGVPIPGCVGQYCNQLPAGVYPTPLYEILAALLLFFFLWSIRKRVTTPGVLAGIYLILNGVERFLIELIRVNTKYNFGSFHPTQAELIAVCSILGGIILIIIMKSRRHDVAPQNIH